MSDDKLIDELYEHRSRELFDLAIQESRTGLITVRRDAIENAVLLQGLIVLVETLGHSLPPAWTRKASEP